MKRGRRIKVYQDAAGEWRWKVLAGNNRIIASSGESFDSRANAERAAGQMLAVVE